MISVHTLALPRRHNPINSRNKGPQSKNESSCCSSHQYRGQAFKILNYLWSKIRKEREENPQFVVIMGVRSPTLVYVGWLLFFALFIAQIVLCVLILTTNSESLSALCVISFVPTFVLLVYFFHKNPDLCYAQQDREIWIVWMIWGAYIGAYVVTVATIFATVAKDLTNLHQDC